MLAAGYGTRLLPLSKDSPKPLMELAGKTILDHLLERLEECHQLSTVLVVTNALHRPRFEAWLSKRATRLRVELLDDGTHNPEERLGAVGDLYFAIRTARIDDDLLVLAADNILRFPLSPFLDTLEGKRRIHICVRHNSDAKDLTRRGNAAMDENARVTAFVEKPETPISQWSVPPIYLFPRETLPRIGEYLDDGGNPDAPGHLFEWLCNREEIDAFKLDGEILDIGNPESFAHAERRLQEPR